MGSRKSEQDRSNRRFKEQVAAQFEVYPDEVFFRSDHKIVVDRRRRYPKATPVVVGEWS